MRKVIVALCTVIPTAGSRPRSISPARRCSIALSPAPKHLMRRCWIVCDGLAWWVSCAVTVSCHIWCISAGTPGSAKSSHSVPSLRRWMKWMPGAVPWGLLIGRVPRGKVAWSRFRSGIATPRFAKSCSISRRLASSSSSGTPRAFASASRVRSSAVGPSPPVISRRSDRFSAIVRASTSGSISSETVVWYAVCIPRSPRRALIHPLLVSSRCPLVNSSPMAITSACMMVSFCQLRPFPASRPSCIVRRRLPHWAIHGI